MPTLRDVPAIRAHLQQAMNERIRASLVPLDGEWLPLDEAKRRIHDKRRKARTRAIELGVLYVIGIFVSIFILQIMRSLAY